MRRLVWIIAMLGLFLVTSASAQDFGVHCFDFNFDDSLRVWAVNSPNGDPLMMAFPTVRLEGPPEYLLSGNGHFTSSFPVEGMLSMSLFLDNNSSPSYFNGNQDCIFRAELDPDPPYPGSFTINCRGENPTFTVSGTMVKIPCDVESFTASSRFHSHSMKGRLAGENRKE